MTILEPYTILQPSLHALTAEDWYDVVLGECESRNIDVADLRKDMDKLDEDHEDTDQILSEIEEDAIGRLWDAGYHVHDDDDCLTIYPKGYEPPDEESSP
ncbi:hypothetical protein LCGC14_3119020 [marine sediment metagenome]|uniref:Uncharacterized protein n=1 Tax=marine sediment metagenome TaxID=412755 RepID=A0A0F8YAB5_9ZZZZ